MAGEIPTLSVAIVANFCAECRSFIPADGTAIERRMGKARFRFNKHEGTSPVVFGQKGDSILLGSVSLEVLGFMLDPFKRELRPLPMLLPRNFGAPPPR